MLKICLQCNNEFQIQQYRQDTAKFCSKSCKMKKERTGNTHSKETRAKIALAHLGKKTGIIPNSSFKMGFIPWNKGLFGYNAGEKNPRWIKDRTKVKLLDKRNNPENNQWKRKVKERDNYKCKIADEDCNGQLEIHHILGYYDHPKLRYDINNGITLCHFHHPKKREEEKRLSPYFMELVSVSKE